MIGAPMPLHVELYGRPRTVIAADEFWRKIENRQNRTHHGPNWAGISNLKEPGPPPDPPPHRRFPVTCHAQWWRHEHHNLLTALHRRDGNHLRFGPPTRQID